ncbi:MAG: hypothetical protein HXS54_03000 [Theionarchaea archaeon]|nr:hypothetical protein [Theionarchaea archaeon]
MTILGLQIGVLQFLQLVTTAVIITLYSLVISLQEGKADRLSQCHMILLTSFIIKYHPCIKNLLELAEASKKHVTDSKYDIYLLSRNLCKFHNSGTLPSMEEAGGTITLLGTFCDEIIIVLAAPIVAPMLLLMDLHNAREYRVYRIRHTEIRKTYISKNFLTFFANVFYLLITFQFVLPKSSLLGTLILILVSIGLAASIIDVLAYLLWQQFWKDYWQSTLLDIMAAATRENDHGLFDRALILRNNIESQPDIPIPGSLGFYLIIYSGVQVLLLWIFDII